MVDSEFFYEHFAKPGVVPRQGQAQRKQGDLNYNAALSTSSKPANFRQVGLWCNVGASSKDVSVLEKLIAGGMSVACINSTFGQSELVPGIIQNIREAEANGIFKSGVPNYCAIALLTRGPEIRTGGLENDMDIPVKKGDTLKLTTDKAYMEKGNGQTVYIDYEDILKIVHPEDRIFVNDGFISLIVTGIHGSSLITTIECDGVLRSARAVFLPNNRLKLPSLTEEDKVTLSVAVEEGVHYILGSKIRNAADVLAIRKFLGKAGKRIKIVAKIECFQALQNIDGIIDAADGIYFNRRYIGVEIPADKVFVAQKNVVAKCTMKGVPVIVGKHFLDSMAGRSTPTRGEAVDLANAVMDGVHGIHISETRDGAFPVECVERTSAICVEAESAVNQWGRFRELATLIKDININQSVALAAVEAAYKIEAAAIIVMVISMTTVKLVSSFRPHVPIIAIVNDEYLARQMSNWRCVFPVIYANFNDSYAPETDWFKFIDQRMEYGILQGKILGFVRSGDPVVAVHGSIPVAGLSNVMQIFYVSDIVTPIAY